MAPQWIPLTHKIVAELNRSKQHIMVPDANGTGLSRSAHRLEHLVNRVNAELSAHPSLLPGTSAPHESLLLFDARRLVAYTAMFHLTGVVGCTPQDTERHLVAIGNTMHDCVRVLGAWHRQALDAPVRDELVVLLLVAATYFCRGVRAWELLVHDAPFGSDADAAILAWAQLTSPSATFNQRPVAMLFGHPLGAQRRWLLSMPLALVAACTQGHALHRGRGTGSGLAVDWGQRVALVALSHLLALGHDLRQLHDADWRALTLGIAKELRLFPNLPGDNPSSGVEGHCDAGSVPLPRWAMGMLSPLLPEGMLSSVWWPQHVAALDAPLPSWHAQSYGPASDGERLRMGAVLPSIRTVFLMRGSSGGAPLMDRCPSPPLVVSVKRSAFRSVASLDNTRVEWAALTHDLLLTLPKASLSECHAVVHELHDRSNRPVVCTTTRRLLEATLRVSLCRIATLITNSVDRSSHGTHTEAHSRERRAALAAFGDVYQDATDIVLRWKLADNAVPDDYWRAVARHLD